MVQDIDRPLAIILAYSVLLAEVNQAIEPKSVLNDLFFLASLAGLAAAFLLCLFSPELYLYTVSPIYRFIFTVY